MERIVSQDLWIVLTEVLIAQLYFSYIDIKLDQIKLIIYIVSISFMSHATLQITALSLVAFRTFPSEASKADEFMIVLNQAVRKLSTLFGYL